MNQAPTWFAVARRPKWVGAFFIAMGVAAICGLLAQWQASRSVLPAVEIETAQTIAKAPQLSTLTQPGVRPSAKAVGSLVRTSATLDTKHFWVVGNRVQHDGTAGYWVVGSYSDNAGNHFLAPLGFTSDRARALAVAKRLTGSMVPQVLVPMWGRLSPAEAPQRVGAVLQSMAPGQLANQMNTAEGEKVYPLFLLVTDRHAVGLKNITVGHLTDDQINWLSAFYAVEWTAFCGVSFFMWWRLVRDEQLRETE